MRDRGRPTRKGFPERALILGAATPAKFESLVRMKRQVALEVDTRFLPCNGCIYLIALDNSRNGIRGVRADWAAQPIASSDQRCSGGLVGTKLFNWS